MKKLSAALFVAVLLTVAQAGATVVTSIPGGTTYTMPVLNYFGPGPQTVSVSPSIIWSSTNATMQGGSVFGYNNGYGFLANGFWDAAVGPMAGVNDSFDVYGVTDTMTFAFATPVGAVGGFLNYVPGGSTPTTIAAYDSSHTLIESFNLTFLTGGGTDSGFFYGFQESTANISYFTLTDNYIAITDLTTGSSSSTPEPSSLLLIGTGLLGVIGYGRRRLGL
jgi:PEP-CTERM motif